MARYLEQAAGEGHGAHGRVGDILDRPDLALDRLLDDAAEVGPQDSAGDGQGRSLEPEALDDRVHVEGKILRGRLEDAAARLVTGLGQVRDRGREGGDI